MIEIEKVLEQINLPASYMKFSKTKKPPFLVYFANGSENSLADNIVYYNEYNYILEYYFLKKTRKKEQEIENIFNKNEIVWEKSEDIYIESENIYMIRYYI